MAAVECRKVLRRVHAVDGGADKRERRRAQAPYAKLMAKISHANPLSVFQAIIQLVRMPCLTWLPCVPYSSIGYWLALLEGFVHEKCLLPRKWEVSWASRAC